MSRGEEDRRKGEGQMDESSDHLSISDFAAVDVGSDYTCRGVITSLKVVVASLSHSYHCQTFISRDRRSGDEIDAVSRLRRDSGSRVENAEISRSLHKINFNLLRNRMHYAVIAIKIVDSRVVPFPLGLRPP